MSLLAHPLIHFALAALVSCGIFVWLARLDGETGFSFPTAPLLMGLLSAVFCHFMSPWVTPLLVLTYAAVGLRDVRRNQAERAALKSNRNPS